MDTFFSDKQQQSFWLSKIIFLSPCLHFNFFLVLLTADSKHELSQKRWRFSKWGSPFLGIPCSTSRWTGPWRIQFEKITKNLCSLSMDPPYILSRVCGECKSLNHSTGFEKPWTQRGVPGERYRFRPIHARPRALALLALAEENNSWTDKTRISSDIIIFLPRQDTTLVRENYHVR